MLRRTRKAQDPVIAAPIEDDTVGRARTGGKVGRGGKRVTIALVPLAILASGGMVYQASNAAFTAQTATPTNNWEAGTVDLADSDSGAALFSVANVKPGIAAASTKCINVTYTGSLAADVKMYVSLYTSPGTAPAILGDYLRVSVEEGTSSSDANCTGFASIATPKFLNAGGAAGVALGTFSGTHTSFANGTTLWAAAAGDETPQVRSYRVISWLPDLAETGAPATQAELDALQGLEASAALNWEARNS